jgi:hypothetical protein
MFVVDDRFLTNYGNNQSVQAFLANPEQEGWKLVSRQDDSAGIWRLYVNVRRLNAIDPDLLLMIDK